MTYEQGPCGSTSSLQEQGDQSWLAQGKALLPEEGTSVGRDNLRFGEVLATAMPSQLQLQRSRTGQFSNSWMLKSCLCGVCRCMQAKHRDPSEGTAGGSEDV